MLIACWSSKGGSGTTVVAASLALLFARRSESGAVLVDLAGDTPAVLGLPESSGPGVSAWLSAAPDVPLDALRRLEEPVTPGLALLPRGRDPLLTEQADIFMSLLTADARPVVVDCGTAPDGVARIVAAGATRSVLVTRPCFLALRRTLVAPIRPSEVVLLSEPGRSLSRRDVEQCVGAPVVAVVAVDPGVARAVDAGLLAARLPRGLARDLAHAA